MANNKLFDEVMEHIEAHQELWDQKSWFKLFVNGYSLKQITDMLNEDPDKPPCGSSGCFAGNAVAMSDWVPIFRQMSYGDEFWYADYCRLKGDDTGIQVLINTKAAELLDIDEYTAETLFSEFNSLEDLREMVAHIKEHGDLSEWGEGFELPDYEDDESDEEE